MLYYLRSRLKTVSTKSKDIDLIHVVPSTIDTEQAGLEVEKENRFSALLIHELLNP